MSSVDNRIVKMSFDNQQFESGVKTTINSINDLKQATDFSGIEKGVQSLQKRFSTMGIVGMEITKRITNAAINSAKQFAQSTVGQIKSGGMTRALNIEQARFQLQGLFADIKNGDKMAEEVLGKAKDAVKGTAYGLDEAAKAASVLAASNVPMSRMQPVLESIAGAAGMTGRSFEDVSNIYATVASNGKLMTMQLRQFSAAGLNVSAVLSKYYHKSEAEINDMVAKGKVSFEDFSQAMLIFGKQAKRANETFSGSLANMKAALNRLGEQFATPYLQNMRDIFNATTTAIDEAAEALKPFSAEVAKDMGIASQAFIKFLNFLSGDTEKHIGPIKNLVQGLINILTSLKRALTNSVGDAFKEIFPKASLKNLGDAIKRFRDLSEVIGTKITKQTRNFKDGFSGLFTIIKAITQALGFLKSAVDAVLEPFGGLIGIVGTIFGAFGRAVKGIYNFISGSETLKIAADYIVSFLGNASQAIHNFVSSSFVLRSVNGIIHGVGKGLSYLGQVVSALLTSIKDSDLFSKLSDGLSRIKDKMQDFVSSKGISFSSIFGGFSEFFKTTTGGFDKLLEYLSHLDFGKIIDDGIAIGLSAAILRVATAFDVLVGKLVAGKDAILAMPAAVKNLAVAMKYQLNAVKLKQQAIALLLYAGAMAVLVVSVKALAKIALPDLIKGMVVVFLFFEILNANLKDLIKITAGSGVKGIVKASLGLLIVAGAVKTLSKAVSILASVDFLGIIKGLVGLKVIFSSISTFLNNTDFKGFGITKGIGLMAVAESMKIMSDAVGKFGSMSLEQLAKGLVSIGVLLTAISGSLKLAGNPKHMIAMGTGLVLMAASMTIFSKAVGTLGGMQVESLVKGVGSIIVVLAALTGVVNLMPAGKALAIGLALTGMSLGILAISGALKILSGIAIAQMGVALLGVIAPLAALGLLAKLVNPISLIATSAAIVIFSAGIALLTPVLMAFSQLSLEGIVKSLAMLAGVLAIFGIAAALLAPVAPLMILLGVAIGVLGAGVLVTAAGLMLLAAAFTALAAAGTAGAAVLVAAFTQVVEGIVTMVPTIATALGEAIITFITTIASHTAELVDAAVKLGTALLDGLTQLIPKLVSTGMKLILSLLSGIAQNIGQIAAMAVRIIVSFIQGIASMIGPLIQAGINLMLSFILGLANGIRDNSELFFAALGSLLEAMLEMVLTAIEKLASHIPVIGKKIEKGLKGAKKELRETFDVEDTNKEFKKKMEDNQKAVEELAPNFKIAGQKNKDALKEGTNGLSNEMAGVGKDGIVAMLDAFKAGEIDLKDAGISLDAATMEGLKSGDLSSADVANTLMKGYSDSIAAGGENAKSNAKGVNDGTVNEFSKGDDKVKKSGEKKVKAYAAGISPKNVLTNVKEIMAAAARAFSDKTAVGAVQASGTKTVENYASGINKGKSKATTAGKSTANNAKTGMESVKFDSAGLAACSGFLAGLNNASYAARITARGTALGNMAYNAAKNAIKAHSPSKKFEQLGIWADQGLINGLKSLQGRVYSTSYAIGENSVDALSDSMTKVYEILNSDLDMNPTITPVLDLSNVQNGIDSMNGMLDTRTMSASISGNMRGIGLQPAFAAATGDNVTNNNTNTFNITVDGAESPEAFADRLVEAIHMRQRMS